jgi:periplasmic divalent cation tolerance protein
MSDVLLCFCTCPTEDVARRLAELVVNERLAACVNILPGLTSVYRWQGAVETASEVMLWIKTTRQHYPQLEVALQAAHPYELPEIVAVSLNTGSHAYLQWINDSLA